MTPAEYEQTFNGVIEEIDELNLPEPKARYLGTEEQEQEFKHKVFAAINDIDPSAAPKVRGPHKEAFVIINFATGQTLNTDLFVNSVSNEVQAFNVDFWRVIERAQALFPEDTAARNRYLVTAAVDTIATAMVLTAGDQRVGVRS
jgi:hypothetical protein